ncbi:MAG: adenylate/guanylate cyclase domain-containing protein [Bacteroidota bacterium]
MLGSRKLTTIVFADIAGYSAMMQNNETNALSVLDRFKHILEEETPLYAGKIVQYYGDGSLLSFDSTILALHAAIAMQGRFIADEVPVRIGMHLGDVLFRNGNAFGNGVNVASRVESLGVPGAVLLTKAIGNQIRNQPEFELTSLGPFHFKNIEEPMEVFAIANQGFTVPAKDQMKGKLQKPKVPIITNPNTSEWERYQLMEIMDALEEKKCVLILGNYAFSKPMGAEDEQELFLPDLIKQEEHKWIEKQTGEVAFDYFTSAQSLVDKAGGQRLFMDLTQLKIQDLGPKQINRFKQISEIPFDLILSTYPFDLVHDVFDANQIAHQYDYYSYMQEAATINPFSESRPLLYNLFGSTRHKESMVISLDRLYQFIFGILGVRQLPKLIQDKVQQASHLVFLGFSFDDWYMKLLLRVLKVHEKEISYAHPPSLRELEKGTKQFFESNFKITFLDKRIDEFVDGLHQLCVESNVVRNGIYTTTESPYEQLQSLNEDQRFEEVLEQLDEILIKDGKEGSLLKELGEYQQNFHKMKELENYSIFSKQELEKKWRQLRNKLSMFIDRVSEIIPA